MRIPDEDANPIPPICEAVDKAIVESGMSARQLAEASGTISESVISKYRSGVNIPDRDSVLILERALGKSAGYISALAGYVEENTADDLIALIETTPALTDAYRRVVLRMVEGAIADSREERKVARRMRSVR